MSSFSETLRRNIGTISLSLLIAAGVAYYVLAYVPQKTARLNGRYFRVLERIGFNVRRKIEAQFKVQEGIAWLMEKKKLLPPANQTSSPVWQDYESRVASRWQELDRETPGLAFEALDTGRYNPTQPQPRARADRLHPGRLLFYQPLLSDGQSLNRELVCSLALDSLVRMLRRPDVFDYFMVFDPATRQLLYSSTPTLVAGDTNNKKLPAWLSDSTGLRAGKTGTFVLQGQPHHLFAQPVRLTADTEWLLCGAVPAESFDAERHSISVAVLETSLTLLLLGLLALPFLKLAFMNAHERLNRPDVLLCAASLVLGSGLVVLGIQSFVMRHWLERDLLENQLTDLNAAVRRNLLAELARLDTVARRADSTLALEYGNRRLPRTPLQKVPAASYAGPLGWQAQQPDTSDLLLWIDADGRGRVAFSDTAHGPYYVTNLRGRRYFQKAQHLAATTEPAYYLESVVSYKDTRVAAALARPSRWASLRTADSGAPGVCLLSTSLLCLTQPVLPPGYSFCLIDEQGEVLFHSDARLSLSENLLDDAEPAAELRAALFAQTSAFATGTYQGHHSLLRLEPLTAGSRPMPDRYLVTIADLDNVQTWQLQTLSEAAALLGGFWALLALLVGLLRATAPRSPLLLAVRHSFPHLWPRRDYQPHYARLAAANGIGLLAMISAAMFVNPLGQLFLLLLLPLYLYPLTYRQLRLKSELENPARVRGRIGWLALVVVLLNLGFAPFLGWTQLVPVLLFQAVAVGLVLVFSRPERLRWLVCQLLAKPMSMARTATPARPSIFRRRQLSYRFYYSAMLLSWIMVLSIVPALYCYSTADGVERMYQIRYTHLSLDQQLQRQPVRPQSREMRRLATILADQWARFITQEFGYQLPYTLPYQPSDAAYRAVYQAYQQTLTTNQYFTFFFNTKRQNNSPLMWGTEDTHDWWTRNYAILMGRKFYGLVHYSFASGGASTQRVLPTTAADAAELGRWGVTRPNDLAVAPQVNNTTYASATHDKHWFCSYSNSLFGPALPGLTTVASSSVLCHPLWVLLGLLLGLLYLLYRLVRYAIRWIFALIVLTHRDQAIDLMPAAHPYAGLVHQLLLTPAASTLAALPAPERATLNFAAYTLLDCRTLPPADELPQWLSDTYSYSLTTVVLEYFEHAPQDADLTERKAAVVEWLLCKSRPVLILSRLHPAAFADCGHPLERECAVAGHARLRQAGATLLDALAYFRVEYLPLQPLSSQLGLSDFASAWSERQQTLLDRECASMPFLQQLRQPLQRVMQQRWLLGQRLDADNIVLVVQRMAQFHYGSLWRTLSPQEKFFLYDMAQDGLVNPRSGAVMDTLLQKGFLKVDVHGRLRLVNDSFRGYILSSVRQQQALRFEQSSGTEGSWAALHLPLLLLLTSGTLFIFVTQRAAMTEAQQFLTAFLSLLPLLGRLLSSFSPFSSSSEKPEIKI